MGGECHAEEQRAWHTCYFFATYHRTRKWKASLRKSYCTIIASYKIPEGGYNIFCSPPFEPGFCPRRLRSTAGGFPRDGTLAERRWVPPAHGHCARGQPARAPSRSSPLSAAVRGCLFLFSLVGLCSYRWNDGSCRQNSALQKSEINSKARQLVADYHS